MSTDEEEEDDDDNNKDCQRSNPEAAERCWEHYNFHRHVPAPLSRARHTNRNATLLIMFDKTSHTVYTKTANKSDKTRQEVEDGLVNSQKSIEHHVMRSQLQHGCFFR